MIPLTDAELTALAAEVDAQLEALQSAALTSSPLLKTGADPSDSLPAASAQQAVIERATGENFEVFWQKFLRQARRDLCLPGGKLHEQWQKWGDLDSKAVVGHARSVLVGMGIGAQSVGGGAGGCGGGGDSAVLAAQSRHQGHLRRLRIIKIWSA